MDFEAVPLKRSETIRPADLQAWEDKRTELIYDANKTHFSNDIELSKNEIKAEKKLMKLRQDLLDEDDMIAQGAYYDKLPKLLKSNLYECLNVMPKPAVHHIHLTAAASIEYLVDTLCYYDFVYFN